MHILKIDPKLHSFSQYDFHHAAGVDFNDGIGLVRAFEVPVGDFLQRSAKAGGDAEFQCLAWIDGGDGTGR